MLHYIKYHASQVALVVKNLPANVGDIRDMGLIPASGRSPGGKHSYLFQCSCPENPKNRGAWMTTVHNVAKSQTKSEAAYHTLCQGQWHLNFESQCCSVAKSCLILCDPMDCSMLGSSVLYYLPQFAQIHVHRVGDDILPSHSLPPPSHFAFSLSQHQGLFQWVGSLHQMDKVLEPQLQHQSFQWVFRVDSLRIDWFDLLAVQGTLKSLHQHFCRVIYRNIWYLLSTSEKRKAVM